MTGMEQRIERGDGRIDYFYAIIIACSGAIAGSVMGFGVPGAIVGAAIGFWAGWDSQKGRKTRTR